MTGFARASGASTDGARAWTWEVRSVNSKGLDVRLRTPPGTEAVEQAAREAVGKRFKRGSVNLTLSVQDAAQGPSYKVNEALLDELAGIAAEMAERYPALNAPTVDSLLTIKGVLEPVEQAEDEAARTAREAAILDTLAEALDALAAARAEEGARLRGVLAAHVDAIAELTEMAGGLAAIQPEALKARLAEQVATLADVPVEPDRLAQEAAVLATKSDVREELDRLRAHVSQARALMDKAEPVGRRLDFLCQEFNREANTLCSKSPDTELTNIGLELKTVIDQLREQVQNIE